MEQKNLLNSTYRKKLSTVQSSLNVELQSENNIAKVLCVNANPQVTNYEILKGELKFSGDVCVKVIYVNENGEFFKTETTETFQGRLLNDELNIGDVPVFKVEVIEQTITNVASDEVKVSLTLETMVDAFVTDQVNCYMNNDDDIITNSNMVHYMELVSHDKLSFNYEEMLDVKNDISRIISTDADIIVTNYFLGTDYFTVEGLINFNMCYESGEEQKELNQCCKTFKFKEELEKEGIQKDGLLNLYASVNDCEIKTEIKDGSVQLQLPINVCYYYLKSDCTEVVVDAFSLKNKLNLSIESFKVSDKNIMKCFSEKIDGQLVIDDDKPRIIKVVGYCGDNINITNSYVDNNKVITEGMAQVNVVYLEEDETETGVLNSVIVEVPFSIENNCDEFNSEMDLTTRGYITDISAKSKKGKEINIDLEIQLIVDGFSTCEEMALTDATVGEALTPKEACLQIYFARKGNTLWDISKGLQCRPEQILNQNPNLNLPLDSDEKIVLFTQK